MKIMKMMIFLSLISLCFSQLIMGNNIVTGSTIIYYSSYETICYNVPYELEDKRYYMRSINYQCYGYSYGPLFWGLYSNLTQGENVTQTIEPYELQHTQPTMSDLDCDYSPVWVSEDFEMFPFVEGPATLFFCIALDYGTDFYTYDYQTGPMDNPVDWTLFRPTFYEYETNDYFPRVYLTLTTPDCQVCEPNGLCIGTNECICGPGWTGDDCQQKECYPPCVHGECDSTGEYCTCDEGYEGDACEIEEQGEVIEAGSVMIKINLLLFFVIMFVLYI